MEEVKKNLKAMFIWSIISLIVGFVLMFVFAASAWGFAGAPFVLLGLILLAYSLIKSGSLKTIIISSIVSFLIGIASLIYGFFLNYQLDNSIASDFEFDFSMPIMLIIFGGAFIVEGIILIIGFINLRKTKKPKKEKAKKTHFVNKILNQITSDIESAKEEKEFNCPYCDIKIKADDARCPNCGAIIKNK